MYIYGKNPIFDLYRDDSSQIIEIFIDKKRHQNFYNTLTLEKKVKVSFLDEINYRKIFPYENIQGMVAKIKEPKIFTIREFFDFQSDFKKDDYVVVLDSILDPQNFGSIIRNSAAFESKAIIFSEKNNAPLNATTIKSSAGTWINVNFIKVNSIGDAIRKLKDQGFWVFSTSIDEDSKDISFVDDFDQPIALILGNEGFGIKKIHQKNSDIKIKIKTSNKINSLNVASTSSIIMHRIFNKKLND